MPARLNHSFFWLFATLVVLAGCDRVEDQSASAPPDAGEVVVYTALDQQFSEPILDAFEQRTGIRVRAVYDTEAVKTVGLVNRLIAEKNRPACDVFWNNEIVRTIQLKREGVTQPYDSPSAATIPDELRDPDFHWTGFAARARVLCINTERLPDPADHPTRVDELAAPKWKGRAGFAKPLFGTTSTHAAIHWAEMGDDDALDLWQRITDNAIMYAGNAQARDAAADGEIDWCLTDTDDAQGAVLDGKPVRLVYPDSGPDEVGTVLIPNTLALIQGAPNEENGRALIDYLLGEEVEVALSQSRSAQIPVRPSLDPPDGLPSLQGVKIMAIDWEAVADALVPCQTALRPVVEER
ncbi:MAG: iron(III) transport system substrate-binding protein [Candidatus Sumerlaeota bacterium]|nr:iron(III) transport system substrate-binding protein [Candidatus Sumerlaeota bacterium]